MPRFSRPSCVSLRHPPVKLPPPCSSRLSPLTTPISTSQDAAGGMGADIMKLFTHEQTSGASFPTFAWARVAGKFLVGTTLDTVKDIHPDTWDFVLSIISKAAACNKLHLFTGVAFRHFTSDGVARFDQTILLLLHKQTFCHIILNVGCQISEIDRRQNYCHFRSIRRRIGPRPRLISSTTACRL